MPSPTDATASTVSAPLSLAALVPQAGEPLAEKQVNGSGGASGSSAKRRRVQPELKATLTSLTVNNLGTLKKLMSVVCPTRYSDALYKSMLDPALDDVNKLIYYADIPVGAILCRMAPKAKPSDEDVLEILALAVLAPYRNLSLGTALLTHALSAARTPSPAAPASKTAPATAGRKAAARAVLYVQEGNEEGKRFYEKAGFTVERKEEDYYKSVQPSGAWLMEKRLA